MAVTTKAAPPAFVGRPPESLWRQAFKSFITHRSAIIGIVIILFLVLEPHGLARLWSIGKEKMRLWPFPH